MSVGRRWPAEGRTFEDPDTGTTVRQLTNYKAHSHHLYFTNPGWYDDGRRLLIGSDRGNASNLYSIDLASGELTQLTDLDAGPSFLGVTVNPARPEAYFAHDGTIVAIDLHTTELRTLWQVPDGFRPSMMNCTADGEYVCGSIIEDVSARLNIKSGHAYSGFRETFDARPLSRVWMTPTAGGETRTVHEERYWIAHVNTSPTRPRLISFCHEGPWAEVDNRIWCLDLDTGERWKVRERGVPGEAIGHEYWFADGERLGYHGRRPDGTRFFGNIRYDDTEKVETLWPGVIDPARSDDPSTFAKAGHIHSNDHTLIVGDGGAAGDHVLLWRWNGEGYESPRKLCRHRGSFHVQILHVHPRFTPDGKQVLFTADPNGYGNLYLADVPEFETLPEAGG